MPRRALTWTLALPLISLSVLGGHALAYAATGVDPGPLHGYLAHVPQVLVVLLFVSLVVVAPVRRVVPTFNALPFFAPVVFAAQEHLERYAHSGQIPMLLTDRTFLVGLALQLPLAALMVHLSQRLVCALGVAAPRRTRPPRLWSVPLPLLAGRTPSWRTVCSSRGLPARGPPGANLAH